MGTANTDQSNARVGISRERVKEVLDEATWLHPLWVGAACVVALVGAFRSDQTDSGMRWHFALGTTSIVALALVWLPTALRFVMLAGGSVKAGGVEASATGLLSSPDDLVNDLAVLRTKTETIGRQQPAAEPSVEGIDSMISRMAVQYLPPDDVLSTQLLNQKAREYDEIRDSMPSGDQRTQAMTKIVNDARIRAAAAHEAAKKSAPDFLASPNPGDRVVGLALVQGAPTAAVFADVLHIFKSSVSAFEAYHALRALDLMTPVLNSQQSSEAAKVLLEQQNDPRGVGLMQDPWIPKLMSHVSLALSLNS